MASHDELKMVIIVLTVLAVTAWFLVGMIRTELQDRKRYKERYDEQGRPNRPGGWGIQ